MILCRLRRCLWLSVFPAVFLSLSLSLIAVPVVVPFIAVASVIYLLFSVFIGV